jgi:hypothetical protein
MGGINYTIPNGYFTEQQRKQEDTEIPSMRAGKAYERSGPAAATGANAAALPRRLRVQHNEVVVNIAM